MIVEELLNQIKNKENYIINSIILKSNDNYGCVYKWLEEYNGYANRKEIFIQLDETQTNLQLEDKTVVGYIEIIPAL